MKRTGEKSEPLQFWTMAHSMGAAVLNDGLARTTNPLLWAAVLHVALEQLLESGGAEMQADFERAKDGLAQLELAGVSFAIGQEEPRSSRGRKPAKKGGKP